MSETTKSKRKLEWVQLNRCRTMAVLSSLVCKTYECSSDEGEDFWSTEITLKGDILDGTDMIGFDSQHQAQEWCQEYVDDLPDDFLITSLYSDNQDANRDFMRSVGQPVRDTPGMPSEEQRLSQFKIIFEEVLELADGWGITVENYGYGLGGLVLEIDDEDADLIKTADALADVAYTIDGAANASGIALQPILDEVCANNMLKVDKGEMVDGKLIKPKDHPVPDIEGLLKQQGWSK